VAGRKKMSQAVVSLHWTRRPFLPMKTQKDAVEPSKKKVNNDFVVNNDFSSPISKRFLPPRNFTNSPKVCEIDWSANIFFFFFFKFHRQTA
jgi:hypothetical protein